MPPAYGMVGQGLLLDATYVTEPTGLTVTLELAHKKGYETGSQRCAAFGAELKRRSPKPMRHLRIPPCAAQQTYKRSSRRHGGE